MELLRLLTAGSVDDGKSTLIGRLFYDSGKVADDHLEKVKSNLAYFTDGLKETMEKVG